MKVWIRSHPDALSTKLVASPPFGPYYGCAQNRGRARSVDRRARGSADESHPRKGNITTASRCYRAHIPGRSAPHGASRQLRERLRRWKRLLLCVPAAPVPARDVGTLASVEGCRYGRLLARTRRRCTLCGPVGCCAAGRPGSTGRPSWAATIIPRRHACNANTVAALLDACRV